MKLTSCISFRATAALFVFFIVACALTSIVRVDGCIATSSLNLHVQLPLTYLAPMTGSQTEPLHSTNYAGIASAAAAVDIQNAGILAQNTAASLYPSIFNQNISYGGTCFSINLYPRYSLNLADYNNDNDFAANAVESVAQCEHTNNTLPKGIAVVHGSQLNDDMFDSTSTICNSFQVSTLTYILRDKDFSRVSEEPYQLRTGNMPRNSVPAVIHVLNQFHWTRLAIIDSTLPPIVDMVNVIEADAIAAGVDVITFQVQSDTSCPLAWDEIIANDWKIIFFIPTVLEGIACLEDFHTRNLAAQNFVMIFSDDFLATLLDNWSDLEHYIQFPMSYFHGHLLLNADINVVGPTSLFLPFMYSLAGYYQTYNISQSIVAETYVLNFLVAEAVNVISQGTLGMLGERLATVKSTYPTSSTSTGASGAALAQQLTNDFLSKYTVNLPLQSSSLTFSPSSNNVSFDVTVPYGAIGFNLTRIFYWMTNASGAESLSILEYGMHFDSNGVKLGNIFAANINQSTPNYFSYWSNRFGTFNELPIAEYYWPNASLLSKYARGWPADRNPPTAIQLTCVSCGGATSGAGTNGVVAATLQPTPVAEAPANTLLFTNVANLQTVYELDVYLDSPQLYTFQTSCDGTAPLTYSLSPLISQLSVSSSSAMTVPLLFNPQTGQIQVNSALLFSEIEILYSTIPSVFHSQSTLPSLTLSQLQALSNVSAIMAAAAVTGVVDSNNNAYVLNFLLNCDNTANNFSAALRIVTHGLPDIYTPSSAQQGALIAVNSVGIAAAVILSIGVIRFKNTQVVFSSSFLFLLIILLGFGLLFVSALLSILTATSGICQAKTICFHFGFTIALGALFSKTYRLHRIFNSRTIQLLVITNNVLVAVLFFMVLVDAFILALWIEISGIGIFSSAKPYCYTAGSGNNVFPAIFTALKGLLILAGIYFTIKVRSVPANFNESRYISIVIYNTAVLGILYVAVYFGTSLQPNELAMFTSVVLFVATFLNMSVFFGSKLYAMGQTFFHSSNSSSNTPSGSKQFNISGKAGSFRETIKTGKSQSKLPSSEQEKKEQEEQDSDKEGESEEEKNMDRRQRLRRRLQRERIRFLQTVSFVKQRESERNRVIRRNEEIQSALVHSYDALRALVIKLRLNSLKFQRVILHGAALEAKEQKSDVYLLNDIDALLGVPLDEMEVDESGQNYTISKEGPGSGLMSQTSSRRATNTATTTTANTTPGTIPNTLGTPRHGGTPTIMNPLATQMNSLGGVELISGPSGAPSSAPSPRGGTSSQQRPSSLQLSSIDESADHQPRNAVRQSLTIGSTASAASNSEKLPQYGSNINLLANNAQRVQRDNSQSSVALNVSPGFAAQNIRLYGENDLQIQDQPKPKAYI